MARAKALRSKSRGGASAPARCKTQLKSCMRKPGSGTPKGALKSCMVEFNSCRGVGRKRKSTKKRRARR